MKKAVTPWLKNTYSRASFFRQLVNSDSIRGRTGQPWLYVKVAKARNTRWYYEAWYHTCFWPLPGKRTSPIIKIEGFTFSKEKSISIVDAWLAKRKNLRILSKEQYQRLLTLS